MDFVTESCGNVGREIDFVWCEELHKVDFKVRSGVSVSLPGQS